MGELVERIRAGLGPELLGAYLTGSLALGDYLPGRSDIDVCMVTRRVADHGKMRRLVATLSHRALPCPAEKLELVVYPEIALRGDWPSLEWTLNLNTGPRVPLRASFSPDREPGHWFVLDIAIAREHARSVFGPPRAVAFPSLDRARVLEALLSSLEWHAEHDDRGVESVLSACRALRYVNAGDWWSKGRAAAWAQAAGPDGELVSMATRARRDRAHGELDRHRVAAFVAEIRNLIVRYLERDPPLGPLGLVGRRANRGRRPP